MVSTRLRHSSDRIPGIARKKSGHGWAYFLPSGEHITDRDEIDRLNAIALPPAYTNAWFCPYPNGHILATGVDARGRKQYRYHPDFRAQQEADKFERCADFGRALPRLRARVDADLAGRTLARDTVIAAVVRLLDLGHIRVGNETYAKSNKSFGATTLRNRHARIEGQRLRLEYVGKSGKKQRLTIEDRRLARIVRQTQDLPGQHLFEYLDEDGTPHPVTSEDVNEYIREATGTDFTAKHFRTWGASLLAFEHILDTAKDGKIGLKPMLEAVASALGNTPAISRKSYIHPALIELCRSENAGDLCTLRLPRATHYLTGRERALIGFLDEIVSAQHRHATAAHAKAA